MDCAHTQSWRDLPALFGNWSTAYTRYRDWVKADVFKRIFDVVSYDPDMEFAMVDATNQGWTTKLLALTDALGNLVRFHLLPGQRCETMGVAPLIAGVEFGALIADKAFDSNCRVERTRRWHFHFPGPTATETTRHRRRNLQMGPPHRKFLLQAQRVQTHRTAQRQKPIAALKSMIYLCAAVINSR